MVSPGRLSQRLCVSAVSILTTDELSERRSDVADSPGVQRRVPGGVEMRQNNAHVDNVARDVAVGTKEQHRIDSVER